MSAMSFPALGRAGDAFTAAHVRLPTHVPETGTANLSPLLAPQTTARHRITAMLSIALALHLAAFLLVSYENRTMTARADKISVQLISSAINTAEPALRPPPPLNRPSPATAASASPATVPVASMPHTESSPQPANNPLASSVDAVAENDPAPLPATLTEARFDTAYLNNPKPFYPPLSRRLGEQGNVLLRVRVSAQGEVMEAGIERSSGYARLDDSARKTVERWRFLPARRGDTPVESTVLVPLGFSLEG